MRLLSLTFFCFLAIIAAIIAACSSSEPDAPTEQPAVAQQDRRPQPSEAPQPAEDPESQAGQTGQAAPASQIEQQEQAGQAGAQEQVQPEKQDPAPSLPEPSGPPAPAFDFSIAVGYLSHLTEAIGPRASGTAQERAAAEYIASVFSEFGYEVELQAFEYTAPTYFSSIRVGNDLGVPSFRFPNSGREPASGDLASVPGVGQLSDFASVEVEGKIAIVNRGVIEFRVKAANAEAAGAVGLVVVNATNNDEFGGTFGSYQSRIPVLQVRLADGEQLRTRLGQRATIPPTQPSQGTSQNVIARTSGGQCKVVVGGHYDTVPDVVGANDNASGTALTLALAAIWADHPSADDICFLSFGAEELGLHGSAAFVRLLRETGELEDVTAMLNLDAIGDGRRPFGVVSSFQLQDIAESVAERLQINAAGGSLPINVGSDHASFVAAAIPAVFIFAPGAVLHVPADNLDNLDQPLYEEISRLNHGILSCLLLRAGSSISPPVACQADSR